MKPAAEDERLGHHQQRTTIPATDRTASEARRRRREMGNCGAKEENAVVAAHAQGCCCSLLSLPRCWVGDFLPMLVLEPMVAGISELDALNYIQLSNLALESPKEQSLLRF
jgi:hypothetical protein